MGGENGMPLAGFLTNHDLYFEFSTSKFKSVATHLSFQKVPVAAFRIMAANDQINDDFVMDGQEIHAWGEKNGFSDFRYVSLGVRFNYYQESKSISAPVSFCYYARIDLHSAKAINNNYVYDLYAGNSYQNDYVNSNIDRSTDNTSSINFSAGFGGESKLMINRTTFIRLNGEFNLSTVGITQMVKDNFFTEENTVKKDLKDTGQSLNRFRNMFLLGAGIGMLL